MIAADPRDGSSLVAAWQQDRYAVGGGAAALGVAYSRDGGGHWSRAPVPAITTCDDQHGRNGGASLATGPDGAVYLASAPGTLSKRQGLRTSAAVSVSRDGGATWAEPVVLARIDDRPSVSADPLRPGHAYVVWGRVDRIWMSSTVDGGASWAPPRTIARGQVLDAGAVSVLADGTLLHSFLRAGPTTEALVAARSTDEGATWSPAVRVGTVNDTTPVDRRSGIAVRSAPVAAPSVVGTADGTAVAAWTTAGRLVSSRSTDGGLHWSAARPVAAGAFSPALAASGTAVAVSAYRLRGRARADVVAALSTDGGRRWKLRRVTPVFSLRGAPRVLSDQRFLGHPGLAPIASGGFAAALSLSPPLARKGRADVFFARVAP